MGRAFSSGRPILAPRNETNVIVGRITSSTGSPFHCPCTQNVAISFSPSSLQGFGAFAANQGWAGRPVC